MKPDHDALVADWRKNARRHEDANFRFLHSLKMVDDPSVIDALAREFHEKAFSRVDCTRCANCCKTIPPGFTEEDIARIAAHLGMGREAFQEAYLVWSQLNGEYETKTLPCPFLGADDRCTIYEVRPEGCRGYPHTDKKYFTTRVYGVSEATVNCPGAYAIVREMRRRLRG